VVVAALPLFSPAFALSLPVSAFPLKLEVKDPHSSREYRRSVFKDEAKQRYSIYLECRSSFGSFDFNLNCEYRIDEQLFAESCYSDNRSDDYRQTIDSIAISLSPLSRCT
jgi:hypothetical protein